MLSRNAHNQTSLYVDDCRGMSRRQTVRLRRASGWPTNRAREPDHSIFSPTSGLRSSPSKDGPSLSHCQNKDGIMAWSCTGRSNKELIDKLVAAKLISTPR